MVPVLFFGRQLPPALCKSDRKRKSPISMDGKSHMDGADEVSEVGKVTQRAKDVVVRNKSRREMQKTTRQPQNW